MVNQSPAKISGTTTTAKITRKHVIGGAAGAAAAIGVALAIIPGFEGERHKVYRDVVGVATYCIGETRNPNWNHVYTHDECTKLLEGRLEEFRVAMHKCVHVAMPPEVEGAMLSLEYNIGTGAFCKSSIARKLNAGDFAGACDALMLYDRAGGREIEGLKRRRAAERKVCVEGL